MNILALDTTRDELLAVLFCGGKKYVKSGAATKSGHSPSLFPFIEELMQKAGAAPEKLDAVCAVVGPGSFTGIRIGVAAMNALAFATGAKRIEVNSFELLVERHKGEVLAVIPAAHGNVFAAKFSNGKQTESGFFDQKDLPVCEKIVRQEQFSDFETALVKVCEKKFSRGEFSDMLKPLYLRKSQAERLKKD